MQSPATILVYLERNARQRPDAPAVWGIHEDRQEAVSWKELLDDTRRLATALRAAGVGLEDRVALVSDNRYEWIIIDLAILMARAVHVPIHTSLSGQQIAYQIQHSGSKLVILEGQEVAEKLADEAEGLEDDIQYYVLDSWKRIEKNPLPLKTLALLVDSLGDEPTLLLIEKELKAILSGDLATLLYTSGTTGEPKGVMLSHGNLASNSTAASSSYEDEPDVVRLCILPFSHIYARTCDLYAWICRGTQLAIARSRDTILDDCAQIRPTVINAVPFFYEKLYRQFREEGVVDRPGVLKRALGNRIRTCFSGGAPLPSHIIKWFRQQQLALFDGYGLSEASPVITISSRKASKAGTVGRPIPDVEVRIAQDGEIETKGPHIMLGYWKNSRATSEAIHDGWLSTGDLGQLDDQGFLTITGRKKEILVLSTGKNVAPNHVERILADSPLIVQAMVLGDGYPFLTALIVPDPDRLKTEIRQRGIRAFTQRGLVAHTRVRDLYRHEIARILKHVAHHEQLGDFLLLERGFSEEKGEVTPKGSLRRETILESFAEQIATMYRDV